jgi:hypothetical protein
VPSSTAAPPEKAVFCCEKIKEEQTMASNWSQIDMQFPSFTGKETTEEKVTRDGDFEDYTVDEAGSASVVFKANPDTGGRGIQIITGVGELCTMAVRTANIPPVYGNTWERDDNRDHRARKQVLYIGDMLGIRLLPKINGVEQPLLPLTDGKINSEIDRECAFNVTWKLLARKIPNHSVYSDSNYTVNLRDMFPFDYLAVSTDARESVYQLIMHRRKIVTGRTVPGRRGAWIDPQRTITREEMAKVYALCVADAEVIRAYDERIGSSVELLTTEQASKLPRGTGVRTVRDLLSGKTFKRLLYGRLADICVCITAIPLVLLRQEPTKEQGMLMK